MVSVFLLKCTNQVIILDAPSYLELFDIDRYDTDTDYLRLRLADRNNLLIPTPNIRALLYITDDQQCAHFAANAIIPHIKKEWLKSGKTLFTYP